MVDTPIHRSAVFLMLLLLPALMLSAACSSAETPDAFDSAYAELRAQGKSHEAATELATIQTDGVATSDAFDSAYAELRAQGKSHEAATELATIQTTGSETSGVFDSAYAELRAQGKSHEAATELATIQTADAVESNTDNTESDYAMDAVVVLARYSSSDSHESTQRGQAAEELKMRVQSRELDADHAMNLLDIIAPEASINKRREAAKELARLSRVEDWDGRNTLDAAEELTRLITGNRIDAEKRVKAATELVWRSKSGDLDADNALDLMNDVAPGLSINERIEAASNLVSLSKTESWGSETTKQAAEETFKLVTGSDLDYEKRRDAVVDLTGEGVKKFGGDSFDDEDVDVATDLIKSSLRGDLNTETVSGLLNFND